MVLTPYKLMIGFKEVLQMTAEETGKKKRVRSHWL